MKAFADDINELCIKLGILSFGFIHLSSIDHDYGRESSESSQSEKEEFILHTLIDSKYINYFKEKEFIASGSYGTVMKVKYRYGKSKVEDYKKYFAIKLILITNKEEEMNTMQEVKRMSVLKNKSNIVFLKDHWLEEFSTISKAKFISLIQNEMSNSGSFLKVFEKLDNCSRINNTNMFQKKILFIQMKYYHLNLQDFCDDRTQIHFYRSLDFAHQILEGVENLHSSNIIHGDLAARNIFCRYDKGKLKVEIGDFGIISSMKITPSSLKNKNKDFYDLVAILLQLFFYTKSALELNKALEEVRKGVLPQNFSKHSKDKKLIDKIGRLILHLAKIDVNGEVNTKAKNIRKMLPPLPMPKISKSESK
jgi:serine/threonine protein kinase